MNPESIGSGVIQGGWEYVIAAYVITWIFLVGYALSIRTRMQELS